MGTNGVPKNIQEKKQREPKNTKKFKECKKMDYIFKNIGSIKMLPKKTNMTVEDAEEYCNTEMFWQNLVLHFYGIEWYILDTEKDTTYRIGGWYVMDIFQYMTNEFNTNNVIEVYEVDEDTTKEVFRSYFEDLED